MAKTHLIDGVEYVEVDRKAKVGDKVIAVRYYEDETDIQQGSILTCESTDYGDGSITVLSGKGFFDVAKGDKYLVLEPTQPECCVDERDTSPKVLDLLANLSRRVKSLEQQLADTQRNLERLAQELETTGYKIKLNEGDIAMLDERTQAEEIADKIVNNIVRRIGGMRI